MYPWKGICNFLMYMVCACFFNRACILHQILKEGLQNLIKVKSSDTQLWIYIRTRQSPGSAIQLLCDFVNKLNLSVPQFLHL